MTINGETRSSLLLREPPFSAVGGKVQFKVKHQPFTSYSDLQLLAECIPVVVILTSDFSILKD